MTSQHVIKGYCMPDPGLVERLRCWISCADNFTTMRANSYWRLPNDTISTLEESSASLIETWYRDDAACCCGHFDNLVQQRWLLGNCSGGV